MTDPIFTAPTSSADYKFKLGISGAPGSGKTRGALALATGLTNGGRIAVVNTEFRGTHFQIPHFKWEQYDFLPPYDTRRLEECIRATERGDYPCVIVDSGTHFWSEAGGLMHQKQALDKQNPKLGMTNWTKINELGSALFDTIRRADVHVIVTMRAKKGVKVFRDEQGKEKVVPHGWEPEMRERYLYELDVIYMLDEAHNFAFYKDRIGAPLARRQLTIEYGKELAAFMASQANPEGESVIQSAAVSVYEVTAAKPRPEYSDTVAFCSDKAIVLQKCAGLDTPCKIKAELRPWMKDGAQVKLPHGDKQLPGFVAGQWEIV